MQRTTEDGRQPDFDEYTVVVRATLRVGVMDLHGAQAVLAKRGE
jgi:hypothetical protein